MQLRFSILLLLSSLVASEIPCQDFYFGADLSYVNEMNDCGIHYVENGEVRDAYSIFAAHNCNLVRLRLWHTPSWYDDLNAGNRYSDLADVRRSIQRAKEQEMDVLLDFHLSDNWADPGKQRIPETWEPVSGDLAALQDSLYNYVYSVLSSLADEELLPEMVQIGNETNKGIMQSTADDTGGWMLDWQRNSALFNTAIEAVRNVEVETGENIEVAIHIAGPDNLGWLLEGFWENNVRDFDVIGVSYYWQWHLPTSIAQLGNIIEDVRSDYPGKQVMVFETGYIWTTGFDDNANNVLGETHPDYSPASPEMQKKWLVDLTQEVINSGGAGVIYWEPAWVSSECSSQWAQGSHYENATFFDFDNVLLENGGITWMEYPYENLVGIDPGPGASDLSVTAWFGEGMLRLSSAGPMEPKPWKFINLYSMRGELLLAQTLPEAWDGGILAFPCRQLQPGVYVLTLKEDARAAGKVLKLNYSGK